MARRAVNEISRHNDGNKVPHSHYTDTPLGQRARTYYSEADLVSLYRRTVAKFSRKAPQVPFGFSQKIQEEPLNSWRERRRFIWPSADGARVRWLVYGSCAWKLRAELGAASAVKGFGVLDELEFRAE
jgi:hypothetical protein